MSTLTTPDLSLGDLSGGSSGVASPPQRSAARLLASYYGTAAAQPASPASPGTPSASTPTTARKPDPTDIDSEAFDAEKSLKIILNEKTLAGLIKRDNELILEMKQIDGERKTLVYENYAKLIDASDTIKRMREKVESVESEMAKLSMQVQDITSVAANLHGTFTHRKVQVHQLKSSVALINRLQVLATLPRRLSQSLKDGSYLRVVQFYAASKVTLEKYKHMPLFAKVAADSQTAVANIRTTILGSLSNPGKRSTPLLIEYLKVLVAINQDTPDKLMDLFCESVLSHVSAKVQADEPWVPLLEQSVAQVHDIFVDDTAGTTDKLNMDPPLSAAPPPSATTAPARPKLVATPSRSSVFTVPLSSPHMQSFRARLDDLVAQCFDQWSRRSAALPLDERLAVHKSILADLNQVPRIAPALRTAIAAATRTLIATAVQDLVLDTLQPVTAEIQELAATEPGSESALPERALDVLKQSITTVVERVAKVQVDEGDQEALAVLEAAPVRLIEQALAQHQTDAHSAINAAASLIRIRLAQLVSEGGLRDVLGGQVCDSVAGHAMSACELNLVQWLNHQIRLIETAVAQAGPPAMSQATHPKGVTRAWVTIVCDLDRLVHLIAWVLADPTHSDHTSLDGSDSIRSMRMSSAPGSRMGHHKASNSGSSLQSLGSGTNLHGRGSPSASLTPAERMQLAGVTKLFADRIVFYPRTTDACDRVAVATCLMRAMAKAWVEMVRGATLNKLGFQQLLVDVEYVRAAVRGMAGGLARRDKSTVDLLDEVVTSAYRRCVEPVFLSREVIATILAAAESLQEEADGH
ncbi:Vps51/Vps67-domain-containing protein [Catenaria anguillulae PL171]|uniref:Vacuolar protein sorting-associated protein 51 homolog n=1 Tax=Catenaria anguillulae PL171 TaxID=765915 RepID=A0A1Y2HL60_9FUNG|nr:Vps51/Vps67-domain-containing protein [Catenaria anguillulae PL171]